MKKKEIYLESKFKKFFIEKSSYALPKCTYVGNEIPIYPASTIITRDFHEAIFSGEKISIRPVGRIDLIFYYRGIKYGAEIKYYPFGSSEFWDALKIIGYIELYKFQTDNNHIKPAIMLPSNKIRLEHQLVAGKLGITLFLITGVGDNFFLKMLDDRPHWKQNLD